MKDIEFKLSSELKDEHLVTSLTGSVDFVVKSFSVIVAQAIHKFKPEFRALPEDAFMHAVVPGLADMFSEDIDKALDLMEEVIEEVKG